MANLFQHPPRLPLVAPSILAADFADMADDCRDALDAGGDLLHLDVMDGHFVENLTMGPDMCRALRAAIPDVFLDVHLMVTDPAKFIEPFITTGGADHCTFHVEVVDHDGARRLADRIRSLGATAGLAINPGTPPEGAAALAGEFDLLLVMSVHPGFGGQAFIPEVLDTTGRLRAAGGPDVRVEMDGGLKPDNARRVIDAGCDVLVAGSSVFGRDRGDRAGAIEALRG